LRSTHVVPHHVHDGIAEVVLDNPPVNALGSKAWGELARAIEGSAATPRCACC